MQYGSIANGMCSEPRRDEKCDVKRREVSAIIRLLLFVVSGL